MQINNNNKLKIFKKINKIYKKKKKIKTLKNLYIFIFYKNLKCK